jgi:hypothetical protein
MVNPREKRPRRGNRGKGRARNRQGLSGTKECICPNCDHKLDSKRGVPCTDVKCPKCGTPMKGKFCK